MGSRYIPPSLVYSTSCDLRALARYYVLAEEGGQAVSRERISATRF